MTIDFDQMAAKARAQHEAKAEDERQKREKERQGRMKQTQVGVQLLDAHIIPILERAKQAFEQQNVPSLISPDYDVENYVSRRPSIKFQCAGPAIKNPSGGQSEPKSIPVFISSDGAQIEIGLGDTQHSSHADNVIATVRPDEAEGPVAKALEAALSSYYREVETLRSQRLWD